MLRSSVTLSGAGITKSCACQGPCAKHIQGVTSLQFSRQGTWFASHGQDQQLLIYTTRTSCRMASNNPHRRSHALAHRGYQDRGSRLANSAAGHTLGCGRMNSSRAVEHQFTVRYSISSSTYQGRRCGCWSAIPPPTRPAARTILHQVRDSSGAGRNRSDAPEALSPDGAFPRASAFALSPTIGWSRCKCRRESRSGRSRHPFQDKRRRALQKREGALQLTGFVLDQGVPQVAYLEPNREPVAAQPFHHYLWNVQTRRASGIGHLHGFTHPLIPTWKAPCCHVVPTANRS